MCNASASLNSTSAISWRSPRRSRMRQQLPVVPDRLVERVLLARPVAGARQVRARPCPRPRRRASGGRAAPPTSSSRPAYVASSHSAALRCRRVRSLGDQRAVRGLLDQRVLEAVLGLGPSPALADEVQALQLVQRPPDSPSPPETASSSGRPNCRPRTDAAMSASCASGLEPVDPREDDLLDRRRDLDRDLVDEPPALAVRHERAGVDQRTDELLEEERVPLGGLEDPPLHLVGKRSSVADERVKQLAPGVARQRLERHLARPVRELAGAVSFTRHDGWSRSGRGRQHEQERRHFGVREQALEQLQRGRVRPVQVLEDDATGPSSRESREQLAHDLERPVLQRLGRELGEAGVRLGLEREPEHRAEVRVELERRAPPKSRSTLRRSATRTRSSGSSASTPSHERSRSRNGQYGIDSP